MKEVGQHFWGRKQDETCLLNDSKIYSVFRTKISLGKKMLCVNYICIKLVVSSDKGHFNNESFFHSTQITKKI